MKKCSKCGKLRPGDDKEECYCKKMSKTVSNCRNDVDKCIHCSQPKILYSNTPVVCYCQCHKYNYNIDCGYQPQYVQPIQQPTAPFSNTFMNGGNSKWLVLVIPAACCCLMLLFVIIFIAIINNSAYNNGYYYYGK
uniref:Uncharacterized protein n=1 Tax=Acrobeloides nanus TaxID=290746 RepID=A0A914EC83_9BILA